ncbi:MAG: VCBS repeat-containing protein [Deltaproteobacteria bacterium]|nr:VCBS repeat-containing protein [Deltaproteobacteria bacterium]
MPARLAAALSLLSVAACSRSFTSPGSSANASLTAFAERSSVAPAGTTRIDVSGGQPPYAFSLTGADQRSGPEARVDGDGSYLAGLQGNTADTVRVSDSAGASVPVTIQVGAAVQLTPAIVQIAPGQTWQFSASGGEGPYCFALTAGDGCAAPDPTPHCADAPAGEDCPALDGGDAPACVDRHGLFHAGSCGPGVYTVTLTQAVGPAVQATAAVSPQLSVTPNGAALTAVAPGSTLFFQASGGVPPYHFDFASLGNLSGGAIGDDGVYRSGPTPNVLDAITVTDGAGLTRSFAVQLADFTAALPAGKGFRLLTGDFNGDGLTDLLAVSTVGPAQLRVSVTNPQGPSVSPTLTLRPEVCDVVVGDLTNDGREDVAVLAGDGAFDPCSKIDLLMGEPDGTLSQGPTLDLTAYNLNVASMGYSDTFNSGYGGALIVAGSEPFSTVGNGFYAFRASTSGWTPAGYAPPEPGMDNASLAVGRSGQHGLEFTFDAATACPDAGTDYAMHFVNLAPVVDADGGFELLLHAQTCVPTAHYFDSLELNETDFSGGAVGGHVDQLVVGYTNGVPLVVAATDVGGGGLVVLGELALSTDTTAITLGASPQRPGVEIDISSLDGARRLVVLDGGLADLPTNAIGPATGLVAGDFTGDGIPDLAYVGADAVHSSEITLLSGGYGGELRPGRTFPLPSLAEDVALQDGPGGSKNLWLAGGGLLLLQSLPGTAQLARSGPFLADEHVPAVAAFGAQAWAVAVNADGGVLLALPLVDGGPQLDLPHKPTYAIFPEVDGSRVAVAAINPDPVAPELVMATVSPALDARSGFHNYPGAFDFAFVSGAGGASDLVLSRITDVDSVIELHLAFPDGGWDGAASSTLGQFDIGNFGDNFGMRAFPSVPGGPVDELIVVNSSRDVGCNALQTIYFAHVSEGQLTAGTQFLPSEGCYPVVGRPAFADFDHDGFTDVVFASDQSAYVAWGQPDGGYDVEPLQPGGTVAHLLAGDLLGDGGADLAIERPGGPFMQVVLGRGDRTFY